MNTEILTSEWNNVKTIKAFNKRDDWWLEVNFVGGAKCITQATAEEVNQIEYDLREKGWQIDPSLFCSGFNARPANPLGRWWTVRCDAIAIAELDEPLGFSEDDELTFVSGAGMFTEADYGLSEPWL